MCMQTICKNHLNDCIPPKNHTKYQGGGGPKKGPHLDSKDKPDAKVAQRPIQRKHGQCAKQSWTIYGLKETFPIYTQAPNGFTLVTNGRAKGKAWVEMHKHQQSRASISTTKSWHEIRECEAPRQTRMDTQEDRNTGMEELPLEEDASTIHTTQNPENQEGKI